MIEKKHSCCVDQPSRRQTTISWQRQTVIVCTDYSDDLVLFTSANREIQSCVLVLGTKLVRSRNPNMTATEYSHVTVFQFAWQPGMRSPKTFIFWSPWPACCQTLNTRNVQRPAHLPVYSHSMHTPRDVSPTAPSTFTPLQVDTQMALFQYSHFTSEGRRGWGGCFHRRLRRGASVGHVD